MILLTYQDQSRHKTQSIDRAAHLTEQRRPKKHATFFNIPASLEINENKSFGRFGVQVKFRFLSSS